MLLIKLAPKADPIIKDLSAQLDGEKVNGEQKMAVSLALALILREKAKSCNETIFKACMNVLVNTITDGRVQGVANDQIIVNSSMALAYLLCNEKGADLEAIFAKFDQLSDFRVSLGMKIGVLTSGLVKGPLEAKLFKAIEDFLGEVLSEESGVEEVDCRDIREGRPDEELFRFDGAMDTLGHLLDKYVRRIYPAGDSGVCACLMHSVVASKLMQTLNSEEDFSMNTRVFKQIPAFIAKLPIPAPAKCTKGLPPDLGELMKFCFEFLAKFYLDFESKGDGRNALLNLLMLTNNGGLELSVSAHADTMPRLGHEYVRETICEQPQLQGILAEDFKANVADIIFDKM